MGLGTDGCLFISDLITACRHSEINPRYSYVDSETALNPQYIP
jgi:hypothetical protein